MIRIKILQMTLIFWVMVSCTTLTAQKTYEQLTDQVTLTTSDGVELYADIAVKKNSKTIILLFHQGGSNVRGEYQTILPKLFEEGFSVFAVDLRTGGDTYGSGNRTVANLDKEYSYCEAELDIQAALDYITSAGYNDIVLWGSSFSGTLAIRVANENEKRVKKVIAFSPSSGGPMGACRPDDAVKTLQIPLLVMRPGKELQIESVSKQFELIKESGHMTYVSNDGIHGSSMLVQERVGKDKDVSEGWKQIFDFLETLN